MDFNTGSGGSWGVRAGRPGIWWRFGWGVRLQRSRPELHQRGRGRRNRARRLFRGIRREGDFVNPLIFAIICYEVSAILSGLLGLFGVFPVVGGSVLSSLSLIVAPIFAAIGLFIGAGILPLARYVDRRLAQLWL